MNSFNDNSSLILIGCLPKKYHSGQLSFIRPEEQAILFPDGHVIAGVDVWRYLENDIPSHKIYTYKNEKTFKEHYIFNQ